MFYLQRKDNNINNDIDENIISSHHILLYVVSGLLLIVMIMSILGTVSFAKTITDEKNPVFDTITVDKNSKLKSTLNVDGAISANDNLLVYGNFQTVGTSTFTNAVTASTTLSVASTLTAGAITISGGPLYGNTINMISMSDSPTLSASTSGTMYIFDSATGQTAILPDSGAGNITGVYFDFFILETATTSSHKILCADEDNEKFYGMVRSSDTDSNDAATNFAALDGDGFVIIGFNGSTSGIQGSWVRITNVAADKWRVEGDILATGTPATPFAGSG